MKAFDDEIHAQRLAQAPGRPERRSPDAVGMRGAEHVLHLQRTAGNAAVAQLLGSESDEEQSETSVRDVVGRGGGQPLPASARQSMEASFGQDFSDVRLHSGGAAESSARSVQARAYTVGNEIVLGAGSPSLDSDAGRHTLAHELTHVVQQRSGPVEGTSVGDGLSVSDPSDRFETQAESVADSLTSGGAAPARAGEGAGASVQREEDEAAPGGPVVQREAEDDMDEEETEEG